MSISTQWNKCIPIVISLKSIDQILISQRFYISVTLLISTELFQIYTGVTGIRIRPTDVSGATPGMYLAHDVYHQESCSMGMHISAEIHLVIEHGTKMTHSEISLSRLLQDCNFKKNLIKNLTVLVFPSSLSSKLSFSFFMLLFHFDIFNSSFFWKVSSPFYHHILNPNLPISLGLLSPLIMSPLPSKLFPFSLIPILSSPSDPTLTADRRSQTYSGEEVSCTILCLHTIHVHCGVQGGRVLPDSHNPSPSVTVGLDAPHHPSHNLAGTIWLPI